MSKEPKLLIEKESENYVQIDKFTIRKSFTADTISGRYVIQYLEPISSLTTIFCNGYKVKDVSNKYQNIYALVYNKALPLRLPVIFQLKSQLIDNIVSPIDYGLTFITSIEEERFVVILEQPQAITLQEYISTQGLFSVASITEIIVIPICNILYKLGNLDIVHGYINHHNVYINTENKNITLGNCISSTSGFIQLLIYEPLERAESNLPKIKGEGNIKTDYYALGILCLYLLLGDQFVQNKQEEELINQRFQHGSYNVYVNHYNIPTSLRPLLRGLLNDDPLSRWGFSEIMDWYSKKQLMNKDNKDIQSKQNIIFNNNYFSSTRALAYNMSKNWEAARNFIKEEYIINWLDSENSSQAIKLAKLLKPKLYDNISADKDALLVKSLCILDPYAPIRLKECAITLDALGLLIAYAFLEKQNNYLDYARRTINLSLWNEIVELDYTKEKFLSLLIHLSRAKHALNKAKVGYGMERCLYELNPYLPCLSPNLSKEYIITVPQLLISIDKAAINRETFFIDKHIAAFVSSKFIIDQELNYKNYQQISKKFLDHEAIVLLILLAAAQQKYEINRLNNLALIFVDSLNSVVETINNNQIKQNLRNNLNNNAKSGDLSKLLFVISDPRYLDRDREETKLVKQQLRKIDAQITQLKNHKERYKLGYNFGLKLCVTLAYLTCSTLLIGLIITKF